MRCGNTKARNARRKARDKLKPGYRERVKARNLRYQRKKRGRVLSEAGQAQSERQIRAYYMRAKILAVLDELARDGYISQFNPMMAKVQFEYPAANVTTIDIILA